MNLLNDIFFLIALLPLFAAGIGFGLSICEGGNGKAIKRMWIVMCIVCLSVGTTLLVLKQTAASPDTTKLELELDGKTYTAEVGLDLSIMYETMHPEDLAEYLIANGWDIMAENETAQCFYRDDSLKYVVVPLEKSESEIIAHISGYDKYGNTVSHRPFEESTNTGVTYESRLREAVKTIAEYEDRSISDVIADVSGCRIMPARNGS